MNWFLNIVFIAFILLILEGCAQNEEALTRLSAMTTQVQPIVDTVRDVCNTAHTQLSAAQKDTTDIDIYCARMAELFRALQLAQETAIIAAGGEPCSNGCE